MHQQHTNIFKVFVPFCFYFHFVLFFLIALGTEFCLSLTLILTNLFILPWCMHLFILHWWMLNQGHLMLVGNILFCWYISNFPSSQFWERVLRIIQMGLDIGILLPLSSKDLGLQAHAIIPIPNENFDSRECSGQSNFIRW